MAYIEKKRTPILISHRGNINGPNPHLENRPDYIMKTLSLDYEVEVDVWKVYGKVLLGHDAPQYHVSEHFLQQPGLWLHAKNISAIQWIQEREDWVRGFWHESDTVAMVTGGFLWTAQLDIMGHNVIHMIPNTNTTKIYTTTMFESDLAGICSDYIEKLSSNLVENEDRTPLT